MLVFVACGDTGGSAENEDPTAPVVAGSPSTLSRAIRAMHGQPVVVNYWATWCEPCKEEMPRLAAAEERYGERVGFIGVNVEDDLSAAREFARRFDVPFRSYAMSRADVQRAQNILGLPVTQFFRDDGELAFVHQGEISSEDLERRIEELLRLEAADTGVRAP